MAEESKLFETRIGKQRIILEENNKQLNNILDAQTLSWRKAVEEQQKIVQQSLARIAELKEQGNIDELKRETEHQKELNTRLQELEADLSLRRNSLRAKAADAAMIYEQNAYKKMSAREKLAYQKSIVEKAKTDKKALEERYAMQQAEHERLNKIINSKKSTDLEKEAAKQAREQIIKDKASTRKDLKQAKDKQSTAEGIVNSLFNSVATAAEKATEANKAYLKAEQHRAEVTAEEESKQAELQEKLRKATNKEEILSLNEKIKKSKQLVSAAEDEAKAAFEAKTAADKKAEKDKKHQKELEERQKKRDDAEKKRQELLDSFDPTKNRKQIDDNLNAIYGDQAKYIAKLQGNTEDWRKSVDNVSDAIGFSGIVSKKNVIGKMKELVDSGIAYNIELRAFLAETSANIASTFDATNGTLLRLIRLQQQDSTAARLGMEASLTRLFNNFFQDTTYLKDAADNISAAIIDASATMTRDMSLEFEYTMQKWLGSLYSLGMSAEAVQNIATGINYLGTGNVSALNNNSSLQTLLAMSASRSGGKSYADMLQQGLTSEDTNNLLRGMITYLAEIASSQDNMVTKAAYAELFGMSITDLSSFASLTTSEIEKLYSNTISYQDMITETTTRLSQISKNMSLSDLVDNAIDNAQVGIATTIGSNAFTYGTWKALGLLKDYVGEIPIPGILAAGFGISSDIDLLNVAQTAIAGFGLLGTLVGGLKSMLNGGTTNLNNWNFSESTQRGGNLVLLNSGSTTTTSYSATLGVGGASGDTIADVSMESSKEKAMDESGITSEEIEAGKETPQKIYDAIAGEDTSTVLSLLQEIDDRLDQGRVFYTSIIGQSSSTGAVSQINNLSTSIATAQSTVSSDETVVPQDNSGGISKGSNTSLSGSGSSVTESEDIQAIIAAAVEQAIRNIAGYSSGTGLPVTVTNLTNGGVM